ncbi:N-acetylmuramoyl-L-alanine amidase [Mobilitalea sibirica]|uniref:N-acetylmuramoyl-L-alanine amidase n=1 Tax=Mobilitalea sibirica TaxID=1462919 RepID=A0A8J7HBJ7_9FIRM|nr:N-acetylmuramoyl-L-alanine amidase [Mobilitalea sibirica]MBH1942241.1 N-acetylmuramoyl-L-alanine amidase [Mobilitalea sibirica]
MAINIFIDQGHNPTGYHNTGARGNGLIEENITYQVGVFLANLLDNDPRFDVMLSRPTPTTVLGTDNSTSLIERVRMANAWPADYFISIHANANVNPAINGAEVYVYEYGTQSYWLAQQVMEGILQYTDLRNNGIRINKSFYVLRRTTMPSILVEMGYLTNVHDAEILRNNQYQIAYGMYIGILNYFGFSPQ